MCVCKCAYVCRVWWNGFAPQGWYSNWNGERPERRELCKESNVSLNLTHVAHLWLTWGSVGELTELPGRDATLPLTLHFRGVSALPLPLESLEKVHHCHALPLFVSPIDFSLNSFDESIGTDALVTFTVSWCVFVRARVQWIYLCNVRRTDSNKVHLLEYCKLFWSICFFFKVMTFYIWKTNIVIWL